MVVFFLAGIRPECLANFNEACWNLMEQCWAAEPSERPLLGYVQPQLEAIYNSAKSDYSGKLSSSCSYSPPYQPYLNRNLDDIYIYNFINLREY